VRTSSDLMNPTHILLEVPPTAQSKSGHIRYKGWLCTHCWSYMFVCVHQFSISAVYTEKTCIS